MPLFAIPFPAIDPVAIAVGPVAIRWYALAYIVGLLLGWRYCLALADRPPRFVRRRDIDDFLVWATLGVVLGGRLGYVLFYNSAYYVAHPIEALYLWHGGMSFHGGAIGVTLAIWLFCRAREHPAPGLRRHHLRGGADRAVFRSDREFHQRRAVRARDRRALGGGVSGRRAAAAPSEPALRGPVRGAAAVPGVADRRARRPQAPSRHARAASFSPAMPSRECRASCSGSPMRSSAS